MRESHRDRRLLLLSAPRRFLPRVEQPRQRRRDLNVLALQALAASAVLDVHSHRLRLGQARAAMTNPTAPTRLARMPIPRL
jgi:hypothetical protein